MNGDVEAKVDRTTKLLTVLGITAAAYIVLLLTIASILGVVNSFRAADYAQQALEQSEINGDIGTLIRQCVEPTPSGSEPSDCLKNGDARTAKAVSRIVDADGNGVLDAVEIRQALDRIERALRR